MPGQLCRQMQDSLQGRASPSTKQWFDKYLKGVISYRGLKAPEVQRITTEVMSSHQGLDLPTLRSLSYELLGQPYSEDKFAGILILQRHVVPAQQLTWREELQAAAHAFEAKCIYDWSTCDGFCLRVLGPLIQLQSSEVAEVEACVRAVAEWRSKEYLWHKRASMVSFVNLSKMSDDQMFPGFQQLLLDTCAHNVQCQERFIQTATGWLLRVIGQRDRAALLQFCHQHLRHFTREGLSYATEKIPEAQRKALLAELSMLTKDQQQQQQQRVSTSSSCIARNGARAPAAGKSRATAMLAEKGDAGGARSASKARSDPGKRKAEGRRPQQQKKTDTDASGEAASPGARAKRLRPSVLSEQPKKEMSAQQSLDTGSERMQPPEAEPATTAAQSAQPIRRSTRRAKV